MSTRAVSRLALLAVATLSLTACGKMPTLTTPVAAQALSNGVEAEWLSNDERNEAERKIRRLMEVNTPDGRVEIDSIDLQQRLFGHRYPFVASKRVIRVARTFVYRVEGIYNENTDQLRIDREVEVVKPTL